MTGFTISSQINAVTVYHQGALITRVAELERQGDSFPGEVRLCGLPLSLEDDSVRVRLERTSDGDAAVPLATDVRIGLQIPEPDASLAPADDEELKETLKTCSWLASEIESSGFRTCTVTVSEVMGVGTPSKT